MKGMNEWRSDCGVVESGNKIYVFGGIDLDWLDSIESYDKQTDEWTLMECSFNQPISNINILPTSENQ